MQDETRLTLIAPPPGFTHRVMTRIAEHERAQARRQAMLGSALLVFAVLGLIGLVVSVVLVWFIALASHPASMMAVVTTVAPMAFDLGSLGEALWVAVVTVMPHVDSVMLVGFATMAFALTFVWARVVTGSFQLSPRIISAGGTK